MFEHSLLTAQTAEIEGASDELIAACLLHDVGHLLVEPDDEFGKHTHDVIGAAWLADRFPPSVSEPVRLHVAAKRYLCSIEPDYYSRLSPASQYTLGKQGGPMSGDDAAGFADEPFADDALRLRRWEDDFGKLEHGSAPEFDRYRSLLERVAALYSPRNPLDI